MPHRRTTIDAIRGLCLVNIFVNHIPDGFFSHLSPSRLGFSDSADTFVLLSGLSTVLAARRIPGSPETASGLRDLAARFWRRAARLYVFALVVVLATLGILALVLRDAAGLPSSQVQLLRDHDLGSLLWHTLTLRQAIGHSSVLRLYVALMVLAPILVRLAGWRFWAPLPPAVLLWVVAGHYGLVLPNSLSGEPLLLTVLPWTLLFALGISIGQAMRLGYGLPPGRVPVRLALGFLAAYVVLVGVAPFSPAARDWIATRHESFWLGASKTYQSPLRLLHMLALAYVVVALPRAPVIRLLYAIPRDHVLTRLGRRSLPVFTAGAILVVAANEVLELAGLLLDGARLPLLLLEAALIGAYVALALRVDRGLGRRAGRRLVPGDAGAGRPETGVETGAPGRAGLPIPAVA